MADTFLDLGSQRDFTAKTLKTLFKTEYGLVVDDRNFIDTAILVADYLHESFIYSNPVGAVLALEVTAQPAVSFSPWQDGESVVMAGGEDGFNQRFDRLASEINSVASDLQKTLEQLKILRAEAATALHEVADELNTLHRRLNGTSPSVFDPTGPEVSIKLPPIEDPYPGVNYKPNWEKYVELFGPDIVNQMTPTVDTIWRPSADPDIGVLRGQAVKRIDVTELNGKQMEVWQSGGELILRPVATGVTVDVKPVNVPAAIGEVGEFRQLVDEIGGDVTNEIQAAGGQLTVDRFMDKFGGRKLKSGRRVAEFMSGIDENQAFTTVDGIIDASTTLVQKRLTNSGTADAIIAGAVGLTPNTSVGELSTSAAKFISLEDRSTLEVAANNLDALAAFSVDNLVQAVEGQGRQIDRATAANYISTAKIMIGLGTR